MAVNAAGEEVRQVPAELEAACRGLAKLVRSEYPSDWSICEIAATQTWGEPLTEHELEAIRRLEGRGFTE
jgi:hypothetical protein